MFLFDYRMKRIAIFLGTRPELIKCLPLIKSSTIYTPVFIEQHTDLLSESYTTAKYSIKIEESGSNRLNNIISSILHSDIFSLGWDAVLVQGDTAVAFAAALSAFNQGIPVIHLEAGLRTYNNEHPWPEEGYRKMIDSITSIALCPSFLSSQNLVREGFSGKIHIVGNTSIDAIHSYTLQPRLGSIVLVTLHRRENWSQIKEFFAVIETLASQHPSLQFILPIHPNPLIKQYQSSFKHVQVIDPIPHKAMCQILAECNSIISDSGGIQEEAGYLGKRVFCCRKVTERVELIDTYLIFTPTPQDLLEKFSLETEVLPSSNIYGDGNAYISINKILNN
jgi:UDP-N-acetylglucosamine 2-epimerase (non-hydrolysing)